MTIAEEIIHELKRLRIKANKDHKKAEGMPFMVLEAETRAFKNGLSMSIRVANQINNRRSRKK